MKLSNVRSVLLFGIDLDYILLKCAISYAEQGLNVWYVSTEPLSTIPERIGIPPKDVLKQITFLYFKTYKDLTNQLTCIHLWHRKPQIIIVDKYTNYCSLELADIQMHHIAYLNSLLLDAAATCAKAQSPTFCTFILIGCDNSCEKHIPLIKRIANLYFSYLVTVESGEDADGVVEEVLKLLA